MILSKNSPAAPLLLRFYARCFTFPFEEMGYELQHMFRELEREEFSGEDYQHLEQVLNIVNNYLGEDLKNLRDNYLFLFGYVEGDRPACPYFASEFTRILNIRYDADLFIDTLMDSELPFDPEEPLDSIIYYLEYLSILYESSIEVDINNFTTFNNQHILSWIPTFCDRLLRISQISFYKEVALGLSEYLLQSGNNQIDLN
jgi:TorA maturation chaperone TorD